MVTIVAFAASVEFTLFCSNIELVLVGTGSVSDCGLIGNAAQYSEPGALSVDDTISVVRVDCVDWARIKGAGSESAKETLTTRSADNSTSLPLQTWVTHGAMLNRLTLAEPGEAEDVQCAEAEQGSSQLTQIAGAVPTAQVWTTQRLSPQLILSATPTAALPCRTDRICETALSSAHDSVVAVLSSDSCAVKLTLRGLYTDCDNLSSSCTLCCQAAQLPTVIVDLPCTTTSSSEYVDWCTIVSGLFSTSPVSTDCS
jgi:hypothetical protein